MDHDAPDQQLGQGAGAADPAAAANAAAAAAAPGGAQQAPNPPPAATNVAAVAAGAQPPAQREVVAALAMLPPHQRNVLLAALAAAEQTGQQVNPQNAQASLGGAQAGANNAPASLTGTGRSDGAGPSSGAGPSQSSGLRYGDLLQAQATSSGAGNALPAPAAPQPAAAQPAAVPPALPVALPYPVGVAPRALPKPDKWSGTTDGMRGMIWLAAYEAYCRSCGWDPASVLTAFLSGRALEWWYSLQSTAPAGAPLTWATVQAEFLSYFDPQRRTLQSEALHQLMSHKCTMAQHTTIKAYEREFKRLLREAGPVAAHVQVAWFIAGLTSDMKRHCATQPSGQEWQALDALIQFALGVETRNEMADAHLASTSSKRPRLSAATTFASKQAPNKARNASKPKGQPSKPQGTEKAKGIPGRLKGLWAATHKLGWKSEAGVPYTREVWLGVIKAGKCVICHKPKGTGPGQCSGHPRNDTGHGGAPAVA